MIALSAVIGLRMTDPLSWRSTITTLFASLTFSRILESVSQIEKTRARWGRKGREEAGTR